MKLRIRGNSLRLRLTRGEVAQFAQTGKVEDRVEFGPAPSFIYALETTSEKAVGASFENNRLSVFVPERQAADWADSAQVGIEALQTNGQEKGLRILIEKDFACLEPRPHENETDAFPPPETGKVC